MFIFLRPSLALLLSIHGSDSRAAICNNYICTHCIITRTTRSRRAYENNGTSMLIVDVDVRAT